MIVNNLFFFQSNILRLASPIQSEFKVIFCGDAAVGKTSLIHRICFGKVTQSRQPTMQLDSYNTVVTCNGSPIKLKFWDTVGQERYHEFLVVHIERSYRIIIP